MIPSSATGANLTPTAACTNPQPTPGTPAPGQTTPNPAEVLIGTDFFKGFTVTSDCRCAKMFNDMEPGSNSTLSGTVSGILIFDVPFMMTTGYQYLAPKTNADAPLTNLVTPS